MPRKGETSNRHCSVEGCGRKHLALGFCKSHRRMFMLYGSATARPLRVKVGEYLQTVMDYDGDDCLIWPFARMESGYAIANVDGRSSLVSRIVCERTFGPAPSSEHQAAHSCGKGHTGCVTKKHLRWATPLENTLDKEEYGTMLKGEQIHASKLTEADVLSIRSSLRAGETAAGIAMRYGVWPSCISKVKTGRTWRHL